ncbi:MAG TPA: lipid-A-disaccharide synthase [Thermodesulfobacteriaceae bacterium]|nr:lipid-A-disaccharide synthase [Thermodesulfobacteriaceae bacterium]
MHTGFSHRILIVAGEESGDLYGAELIRKVREILPGLIFYGIGGRRMRAAGLECLFPAEPISVVGLPTLSQLKIIRQAWSRLKNFLINNRPQIAVLIDFPGFNLRLAKICKKLEIPVFYYIAPQVWAWNRRRVKILKNCVDLLAVILPFEKEFFKKEGINVEFVGHPLVDLVRPSLSRETFCEIAGLSPVHPILGIFPGSRESEVNRLLPVFLATYEILKKEHPRLQGVIVKAQGLSETPLWEEARKKVKVLVGYQYEVLKQATAALLVSGTVTLEAAILETPMVAAYRLPKFSFFLAKRLVRVPYITLPNLILDEPVVPEILQDEARPEKLAEVLRPYLFETRFREETREKLKQVKKRLGGPGASWRVADLLASFLRSTLSPSPLPPSAS